MILENLVGEKIVDLTIGVMSEKSKYSNLVAIGKFLNAKCGIALDDEAVLGIQERDFFSICRLLVALAHEFKCPYQLPSNVEVVVVHREVRAWFFSLVCLFPHSAKSF